MTKLGQLLRSARRALEVERGQEIGDEQIADELKARGFQVERKTYNNLLTGRTKSIKPDVANELPKILPVTVLQIVHALGYEVAFEGIGDEAEVALLEAYRQASAPARRAARAALDLPPDSPPSSQGRSLRRLAAMDRQEDQGSQG